MADLFLIFSTVVGFGILLIASLYLLVLYSHPDDKNDAYSPKAVVIFGFVLAGATVLLLPLDVANREGYAGCAGYDSALCGGLNMEILWQAVFFLIPLWVFILIPFSTFYYEADDGMLMAGTAYAPNPTKKSRFGQALCYQIFVLIIVGLIFLVTYLVLSTSKVPVTHYEGRGDPNNQVSVGLGRIALNDPRVFTYRRLTNATGAFLPFDKDLIEPIGSIDAKYLGDVKSAGSTEEEIEVQVSVGTFYASLMAWAGWFLFALFGGVGLAALPLDLILVYRNRPRHMDAATFADTQMNLRERVNELVDIGELIKIEREEKAQAGLATTFATSFSFDAERRKAARDERQAILGFKQAVYLLEQDVEDFKALSASYENYNPLVPYIALLLGVGSVFISLLWFIHICIYVYPDPPLSPFLNNFFAFFEKFFPLFGVLAVALFTFYLLICSVKGCVKFGLRFLFFQIHPMKLNKTYMSSFMFNIGLILLCALPVVQFAQEAFADYAAFSEIRQIFGVQIKYLQFFTFFWTNNLFIYFFMGISILTSIYLACRPKDTAANGQALRDRIRSRRT